MSIEIDSKLKHLLQQWPKNTVATLTWLKSLGIYFQLKDKYIKSNWIKELETGAVVRTEQEPSWQGALYAIQTQLEKQIHVGARTALEIQGLSHFAYPGKETIFLFTNKKEKLPNWFKKYPWKADVKFFSSNFLPPGLGLVKHEEPNFSIAISSKERAILECLYLLPNEQDFQEAFYLAEGLMSLQPKLMQKLLEECKSIKVKRLFLFFAELAKLPVLKKLKLDKVHLGSGFRQIIKGGQLDSKYKITIPKGFNQNG